jgi:6-phosphogluconolactonase/glucosamine-6-phosphate isomerase/deaminase
LVTVSGADKAEALARTVAGETPASRIRAEQVVWLVDRKAAAQLS